MTEKKRQEITDVFKYLRGTIKKKDISNVSFDSYVSYLLETIKDLPLHYQLRIEELKNTGTFSDIISYLSLVLKSLVIFSEGDEYTVKGLKHLSKYPKRNSLYDFIEDKNQVLNFLKSHYSINPYHLKMDLDILGEKYKDLCLLSKVHEKRFICILGKKDLDFELALGLLSYLKI